MGAKKKQPTRQERIVDAIEALGWKRGNIRWDCPAYLWAKKGHCMVRVDWSDVSEIPSRGQQLLEIVQAVDPVAFPNPKGEVKDV